MLRVSSTTRIFVHALPTDMRKSFDGLYALAVHSFGKDVFQGDYFVSVNRAREALGYLRNQWSALQIYLTDGQIPIDNDHSEQRIRPLTIGRNNWLFLGHLAAPEGRLQLHSHSWLRWSPRNSGGAAFGGTDCRGALRVRS